MTHSIGFIGVGLMGHGMAKNLLEKGYAVTAMAHRNREPLEDLLRKSAVEAATPREISVAADVVIICVTGAPQVENVVYGEDGVLAGIKPDMTIIDCSTSEPSMTARINEDIKAAGASLVDAPLARTPVEAEAGRLNSMVGASDMDFQKVEPILQTFCENIFHVGDVGSGIKCKLVNNFMAMGQAALIAEAICACAATGVDIRKYYDVVSAGGANSGIFQLIMPPAMDEGDYSGLKFSLGNAAKDLRYYTRMTEDAQLTGNLGNGIHHALVEGMNLGFDDGFVGDLIRAQSKLNGVKIF